MSSRILWDPGSQPLEGNHGASSQQMCMGITSRKSQAARNTKRLVEELKPLYKIQWWDPSDCGKGFEQLAGFSV